MNSASTFRPPGRWSRKNKNQLPYRPGTRFDENAREQLVLFDIAPDPEALRQRALVQDSDLTRYCAAIVAEHAHRYGWSVRQRNTVMRTLRMLQVSAYDLICRSGYGLTCSSVLASRPLLAR